MNDAKKRDLFEQMPVPRAVGTMVVPTIIGQLIILIYNLADTYFIGRMNNPDMVAGVSLILPVFNIALSAACPAGVGASSLVSRLMGLRENDEAKRVSSFGIYLSLVLAAVISLSVLAFMDPLLAVLGADSNVYGYARTYAFFVVVLGALPTILTNVLSNYVRCIGESGKAGFGITLGGVLNMALDPLFMFVLLPKGNEIAGAGAATLLSNCISCVYFLIVVKKLSKKTCLGFLPIREAPSGAHIRQIFAVGLPSMITIFLYDLDCVVVDRLMSGYGNVALASIGLVLKAERLPLNVGAGICQGMVPIIAYNYSAGNHQRMRKIARFSLLLGVCTGLVSIALYESFAPQIIRFFIHDAETVHLGTGFLRARCIATVFMFMSFYHVNLFNAYGRGQESLMLGVIRWAGFNIPMLFLLNRLFGMYGIVWSQLTADVLTVLLSFAVHRRFLKKQGL